MGEVPDSERLQLRVVVMADLFVRAGVLAEPWMAALAWFFMLLVSPVTLGVATGLLSQRAVVRRLLARYGVYTVHPVPTAWDYVFSHSTGSWVLVTLSGVESAPEVSR